MQVKDIMTHNVYCVPPSANITFAAQLMKRHNIGDVCVCDENNVLQGIITDRDITIECVATGIDPTVSQVGMFMTASPVTVSPDTSLEDCANLMANEQVKRLPVVDSSGKVIGIISLGDIAFNLQNSDLVVDTIREISRPVRSRIPESKAA